MSKIFISQRREKSLTRSFDDQKEHKRLLGKIRRTEIAEV